MDKKNLGYSSQLALVASLIAGSVGTGNIWRFPRVAAANGGGTFIIAWAIMCLLICLPIMMGEHVMGRATRHGTPGAYRDFIGKKFTWMGTVITIIMACVASYYSVVVAWIMYYLGMSFTKGYYGVDKVAKFNAVSNGNIITLLLFVLVLAISAYIAYTGVKGIEKANKVFLPVLLGCLVIAAVRSIMLPGSGKGLEYLFNFELKEFLNYKLWLEALTQAVWSAGPGWGLVITLAVFSKAKSDVSLTTTIQVFGDASASLVAGLAVIPAIFALTPSISDAMNIIHSGNNGLTFISMTSLFENMPGGYLVSIMFFLSLLFAAISSNICHFMIVSLPFSDSGFDRKKSILKIFLLLLVWGAPSAWNSNFLSNQDWVAGQMMLVGALFSCYAIYKFGAKKIREQFLNTKYTAMTVGKWWEFSIQFFAPLVVLCMLLWWSYQSITWEKNWWNPFGISNLGTFIIQGGLMLLIAFLFNDKVSKSIKEKYFNGKEYPDVPDNGYSS